MEGTRNDDPVALLEFDPAAVAIRARNDVETLQKLGEFAESLTRYVGMMNTTGNAAAANNDDTEEENEETETREKPDKRNVASKKRRGSDKKKLARKSATTNGSTGNAIRDKEVPKDEEVPEEEDQSDNEREQATTKRDRRNGTGRKRRASNESGDQRPPQPESGLATTNLSWSVGRTRRNLNHYLKTLGLTANFGSGVVSKQRGGEVSHLTLECNWNDLPNQQSQKLEWWVERGASSLAQASLLDPLNRDQPKEGVPVFWSCEQPNGDEALCHYVGHFRPDSFTYRAATVRGKQRQTLVEMSFVKYDNDLANKIALIPSSGVKKSRRLREHAALGGLS